MKKRILSLALSAFIALALVPALGVDAGAYDVNIDDGISQEELLRGGIPDSPLWPLNTDANGYSSTDARFDTKNYLLATFDGPDGDYMYYTYDSTDRLTHRDTQAFGTPLYYAKAYDDAGRLVSVTTTSPSDSLCHTDTYIYDDTGRLSGSDEYGKHSEYTYTANGYIKKISSPDNTLDYVYDNAGCLVGFTLTGSNGSVTRYTYNADGQLTGYYSNVANITEAYTYTYDGDGNLTASLRHENMSGSNTSLDETGSYAYNDHGKLISAKKVVHTQGTRMPEGGKLDIWQTYTDVYTYNAGGHLTKHMYTQVTPSGRTTDSFTYHYDAAGNMVRIDGSSTDMGASTVTCEYDGAGNLTKRSVTSGGKTTWRTYTYVKRHTPLKASVADFTDVKHGAYYYRPVKWAVEQEITTGTAKTLFSPRQTCTQAQILTFLWRAAGKPEAGSTASYANSVITEKQYYYKALQWAAEKGVVTDMTLDPNAKCSRSDTALYLWRYAGSPASSPAAFTDVAADSPYSGAVAWAVEKGVTKGTSATTFSPDSSCTRGQIVTFLYRDLAEK
jgi:YD repeat-containing protein